MSNPLPISPSSAVPITFLAHRIARVGGMERAAAEVANRLARHRPVHLVAAQTEADVPGMRTSITSLPSRPAVLRCVAFRNRARRVMGPAPDDILISIGAAYWPADVMIVQFCHWAFADLPFPVRTGWHNRLASLYFRWEERSAIRHPRLKGLIAVSKGVASEMARYHDYPVERIRIVPNGVDPAVFHPLSAEARASRKVELGFGRDQFVAVFAGGDWSRKGLKHVLEAVARLPGTGLIVLGNGGREDGAFRRMVDELGLAGRVYFAGHSSRPETFFQAADVMVFPTIYEAFSLVSLEAVACGLPVLMPPVNGAVELIRDGENGFLCERDGERIAGLLRQLDGDRDLLRRMSEAAHRTSQDYSWDRIAEKFDVALRELIASRELPVRAV